MMYAKPTEYEIEFAKRTRINLDQYHGDYEVTQLINSMLGLLVIPRERLKAKNGNDIAVTDDLISKELLQQLLKEHKGSCHNLADLVRRMRNSISHGEIKISAEIPPDYRLRMEIHSVVFNDVNPYCKTDTFEITMSVDMLRKFVYELSEGFIRNDND